MFMKILLFQVFFFFFNFFECPCLVLIFGQYWPQRMSQEVFFQIFWNNLCRIGITSSLNLWQIYQGSSMGLEFSLLEAVNYKYNFFILKELFRLFVSSWLSFGLSWRSNVTCSSYLSCWIYWHKIIKNMPFLFF